MSLPSNEWPEGFLTLVGLVREMGTDWVREACDELEDAAKEQSIATLDNGRQWPQVDP